MRDQYHGAVFGHTSEMIVQSLPLSNRQFRAAFPLLTKRGSVRRATRR